MAAKKDKEGGRVTDTKQQQPAKPNVELGAILREGIVSALAGALKVGRVAAKATNGALNTAGRITAGAGEAAAYIVKPTVPSDSVATPTRTKSVAMTGRRDKTKGQAKVVRKPPRRSGARMKVPGRRRKIG